MNIRRIFLSFCLGLWAICGWFMVLMFFWVLLINNGRVIFDATLWNEFYFEFIGVHICFILVILAFILELREIFNEKRRR